jgi:NRAMP (natural resistance-associated macrophage protein)-like metal ion transporter
MLGPGLIAANAGNDAGAVATHSTAGATYGYGLIWVMVLISLPLYVVQEMCARMGAVTGKGLADLIRERFGVRWTTFAMLTLLVSNAGATVANFAGIAAAAELFGVSRFIAVPLIALLLWLLIARGDYGRVERIFLVMSLVFFAYPIAAFLARPDWSEVLRSAVVPTVVLTSDYILLVIALIGTTITPYMQFFVQAAVVDKGTDAAHVNEEKVEVAVGSIFANVIVIFIQIATAATLYVQGIQVETAADAALALAPVAGQYATVLFGVGLLGASLLAASVIPLSNAFAICEAFGFERGVSRAWREAPVFYSLFTALIVIGAIVAMVTPSSGLIALLLAVQIANGLLLPIILVFVTRLAGDRELLSGYANGRPTRLLAWGTTIVVSALALTLIVVSVVLPLFGITV